MYICMQVCICAGVFFKVAMELLCLQRLRFFFFSCKPFDRFSSEEHMHENIIVNSHAVFCSSLKD